MQQPAGAVAGGVQAGHGGLHFVIHHDAAALYGSAQLPGKRGAARHAQRHEHTGHLPHRTARQLHAGDGLFAQNGFHLLGADGHLGREICGQGCAVRQQGDAFYHRQKRLYLVQGVLAAAQHRYVLSTVEKGIAGGAPAYAVAFQPGQPRDAGHCAGSACRQNDRICRVRARQRFHSQTVGPCQPHGLGLHKLHPQPPGVLDAAAFQLRPGNRLGEAVIIFDCFGACQRPGAFGQHDGLHPGAHGVQSGGHPRRAGTYDNDIGHGVAPLPDSFTLIIYQNRADFCDRVAKTF